VSGDISGIAIDLKRRAARGSVVLLASQSVRFVLQFVSIVALGRLLLPSDFGLIAMVAPVTAFIATFKDLGLTQAVVQRQQISQDQLTTLFWISVSFSVILMICTYLAAPVVGWFYNEPRTIWLMIAFGGQLIFSGTAALHMALLNRAMRYQALALVEIAALAVGVVAGIVTAWLTHSYWALVVASAVTSACTAAIAWTVSGWCPGTPRRGADVAAMLRFGGNLTGFNIVNFFARNLDNILIGKAWGTSDLGLYDRAYKLLLFPLSQISYPISRIATPVLSRLVLEPDRYRRAYLQMIGQVLLLVTPGVVCLVVLADQVVFLLLGPRWEGVVPIFQWLGVGALVAPIGQSTGWLFISQDRTGEMFRWGLVSSTLFVASFVVGLPYGPVGVAACYILVGYFIQAPIIFWAATRKGPVTLADLGKTTALFAVASVNSALAIYAIERGLSVDPIVSVAICLPVSYGISLMSLGLLPAGRQVLRQSLGMIRSILS
jgi:PST family polysaccharide transporter